MNKLKISIRMAVLSVLILSILMVSASVMYAVSDKFNDKLLTFVINDIENVVQSCNQEIAGSLINIQRSNDTLGLKQDFVQLLKTNTDDAIQRSNACSKIRTCISDIKSGIDSEYYGYSYSFFVDDSQPVSKYLEAFKNKSMVENTVNLYTTDGLKEKSWYKELVSNKNQMHMFEDEEIPHYVFFAQIVQNSITLNGEVLGVSLVGIDFESILRDYANIENKEFLEIMIVNSSNEVIGTNDESVNSKIMEFASRYQSEPKAKGAPMSRVRIDGNDYYASKYDLGYGMNLVAVIPKSEVFITIRETMTDVYHIMLILLVMAIIITIVISGLVVRPIKRLSDFMENNDADKSLSPKLKSSRVREIDTLYKSYDSMTQRIKGLVAAAQTLGEQKKETEYRMLQTQINPHYLYNALDSISWLALRKGEEEISDMASSLADSFRYNARTSEMTIDLQSELDFIRNYVSLQEKFRKTEFPLVFDVPEQTLKLNIPKFMLQPLAENAIIHGLRANGEPLALKITVREEDDVLKIITEDSGRGFSPDILNRYLDGDDTVFDTEKIGIINIHKRLKNKYGSRAGLSYALSDMGGLAATITLPSIEEGEKEIEIF